jgi:hypothetical protein
MICSISFHHTKMPATNPRIHITVKPSFHAVLQRLSAATGQSMSSLLAEFLQPNEDVFERMATIIEAASTVQADVRRELVSSMESVQAEIERKLGLTKELFEKGSDDLVTQMESISRRRRAPARSVSEAGRTAAPEVDPPCLTGGSGTPRKQAKLAGENTAKARQVRRSGPKHG